MEGDEWPGQAKRIGIDFGLMLCARNGLGDGQPIAGTRVREWSARQVESTTQVAAIVL